MSADVWAIIGVGVAILAAILAVGGVAYRELRTDVRGLRSDVSQLGERLAKLEGRLSYSEILKLEGDQNAEP